jgi:hypothetical protein
MKFPPVHLEWASGRLDFSPGCLVMGILNVTPDSFSDGGEFFAAEKAIAHGLEWCPGALQSSTSAPNPPDPALSRCLPASKFAASYP